MSHTTKLTKLSITSRDAIIMAVEEMIDLGARIELKFDVAPRMYYSDQFFKATKRKTADIVVRVNSEMSSTPCDLGLVQADNGEYELYFDEWNGYVASQLGNPKFATKQADPSGKQAFHLGKFLQTYTKCAVILEARAQGYIVSDAILDEETGEIHLTVAV